MPSCLAGDPDTGREAAAYLDRILEGCTDMAIRNQALSAACRLYPRIGRTQDALNLAQSMKGAESQRELLTGILCGKELYAAERALICYYLNNALTRMAYYPYNKDENGEYILDESQRLAVFEKVLAGIDLLYEDGDATCMAQIQEAACVGMAGIYARHKDAQNTVSCILKAAKYDKVFDTYDPEGVYTSIFPRGMANGGVWQSDPHNRSYHLLSSLQKNEDLDFVRESPEFKEVLDILSSVAK